MTRKQLKKTRLSLWSVIFYSHFTSIADCRGPWCVCRFSYRSVAVFFNKAYELRVELVVVGWVADSATAEERISRRREEETENGRGPSTS
jgi:hypothetical protein